MADGLRCVELDRFAPEFRPLVAGECPRCTGQGESCLAEDAVRVVEAAARPAPATLQSREHRV